MDWKVLSLLALLLIISGCASAPPSPAPTATDWDSIRATDIPTFSPEWKTTPMRLAASDAGWEDSLFVTADGNRVYFAYYNGDLIGDAAKGKYNGNINIYYSDAPFTTKQKDTRYHLAEEIWSAASPFVDSQGNIFYNTNRDYLNDKKSDQDIWMNDARLPFNDIPNPDTEWGNPHYCEAKDELWFDEKDTRIWVVEHAKANNFSGTPVLAPSPIDIDSAPSFQPYLAPDCQTIYFTSNRGLVSTDPTAPRAGIYRSHRSADGVWSEPELVASSKGIIAEPSMTADGKKLFFIQLFSDGKGHHTTDMYYVEKRGSSSFEDCIPPNESLSQLVDENVDLRQTLTSLNASCNNNGKLADQSGKEIKIYHLTGCWGNAPSNYLDILDNQRKELESLKQQYNVIEVSCNPTHALIP